jgi:tellurite resistance protein
VKKQIEDKQAILQAIQKSGELSGKHTERIENVLTAIVSQSEDRDNQLQQALHLVRSILHIVSLFSY